MSLATGLLPAPRFLRCPGCGERAQPAPGSRRCRGCAAIDRDTTPTSPRRSRAWTSQAPRAPAVPGVWASLGLNWMVGGVTTWVGSLALSVAFLLEGHLTAVLTTVLVGAGAGGFLFVTGRGLRQGDRFAVTLATLLLLALAVGFGGLFWWMGEPLAVLHPRYACALLTALWLAWRVYTGRD